MVNRLWQHHFGAGHRRDRPTISARWDSRRRIPSCSTDLAGEFVGRRLVDQGDAPADGAVEHLSNVEPPGTATPTHRSRRTSCWHRMPFGGWKPNAFATRCWPSPAGSTDALYGPGVMPHLTPFMVGRGRPAESGPLDGDGRRSIYLAVRRNFLHADVPGVRLSDAVHDDRPPQRSNVPAQALALMNNPFVIEQARVCGRIACSQQPDLTAARAHRRHVS